MLLDAGVNGVLLLFVVVDGQIARSPKLARCNVICARGFFFCRMSTTEILQLAVDADSSLKFASLFDKRDSSVF